MNGKQPHPKRRLSACALVLLSWLALLPASAGDIDARLQALMAEYEMVGLAVVVVKDDAVVYSNSLGWKDREAKIPLGQDDLFRIASISKSFVASSILQLVEQERLSLDDDVGAILGFPVRNPAFDDQAITVRMLLNHTSSLTDAQGYFTLDTINPGTSGTWTRSYAARAPGTQYEYSNLGFNMLGAIVERISGQRFDDYVRMHVTAPLGLYAGFNPDALDAGRFARIYQYTEGKGFEHSPNAYKPLGERLDGYVQGYGTPVFSPTGGMKISAPDLAKYMRMHMNLGELDGVRIISQTHAKAMQTPTVSIDADSEYGLALRTDRKLIPAAELTGHTGSAHGLYSSMFFDADRKYGFVVITNGTRDPIVRDEINRELYRHFIDTDETLRNSH